MGGDRACLVIEWLTHQESTVLENRSCVSKEEIDGARDGTVTVKLTMGMCVESVLVTIESTVVEYRLI